MTREQEVLQRIKDEDIAVICSSLDEAEQLFNLDFPYDVNDLSGMHPFKGAHTEQAFYFSTVFGTQYSRAKYAEECNYKTITFKDLMKEIVTRRLKQDEAIASIVFNLGQRRITLVAIWRFYVHPLSPEGLQHINEETTLRVGHSVCHPNDMGRYDEELGAKIAEGRARKKPIFEYTLPVGIASDRTLDAILKTCAELVSAEPEYFIKGLK